jgi:large subunit ribosomal protein L10
MKVKGGYMPADSKLEAVAVIKERFAGADAVLLVDYRGLSVKDISQLRRDVRVAGADIVVYKNTLTQIAMRELALPPMDELLEGPSAFVFVSGDPVAPAKALAAFAKGHGALELKGGLVQNRVIDSSGLKALSALPSREELLAKLLGTLANPARGLVTVLSGPARGLVTALNDLADQRKAA